MLGGLLCSQQTIQGLVLPTGGASLLSFFKKQTIIPLSLIKTNNKQGPCLSGGRAESGLVKIAKKTTILSPPQSPTN